MTDVIVAAGNFAWWAVCSCVVVVLAEHLWLRRSDWREIHTALLGTLIMSAGEAAHRLYWLVWRLLRNVGGCSKHPVADEAICAKAASFVTHGWLTIFAILGITIGGGLLLSPVLRYIFGPFWLVALAAFLAAVWSFGYFLARLAPKWIPLLLELFGLVS